MSLPNGGYVYLGPWLDHEKDFIRGATFTLSGQHSQILASFLAVFIAFVGSQGWRIVSYIAHQIKARRGPSDGLHHQQQIILRNSSSPGTAAWIFVQQVWQWRHARFALFRSLMWATVAVLYVLAFAALSTFTAASMSNANGSRLVRGPNCGYFQYNTVKSEPDYKSMVYMEECYQGDSTSTACSVFPKPRIDYTTSTEGTCPFIGDGYTLCQFGANGASLLDTGLLSSGSDFGINTGKAGEVQLRKISSCSPLKTPEPNEYTFVQDNESTDSIYGMWNDTLVAFNYGAQLPTMPFNYTYAYDPSKKYDDNGYELTTFVSVPGAANDSRLSTFVPIDLLTMYTGDISLLFFEGNSVRYDYPNNDPLFLTQPSNSTDWPNLFIPYYDVSIMACVDQYAFCNPLNGVCTNFTGAVLVYDYAVQDLDFNQGQKATFERLHYNLMVSAIDNIIGGRGAAALQAQNTVLNNIQQVKLPDDQWLIEHQGWFNTSLALLQSSIFSYSTAAPPDSGTMVPAVDPSEHVAQCNAQKTNLTMGTVNYSAVGVGLVVGLGSLVILIASIQEPVISFFQRRVFKKSAWRSLHWSLDNHLQLQRMLFESLGMGGEWTQPRSKVPVTRDQREIFGGWSDVHEHSPRLPSMSLGSPPFSAANRSSTAYEPHPHGFDTVSPRPSPIVDSSSDEEEVKPFISVRVNSQEITE